MQSTKPQPTTQTQADSVALESAYAKANRIVQARLAALGESAFAPAESAVIDSQS